MLGARQTAKEEGILILPVIDTDCFQIKELIGIYNVMGLKYVFSQQVIGYSAISSK